MKKKKQFRIPGIYHELVVKVVTQKWLSKYIKGRDIMGIYEHGEARIYVVKELSPPVKLHTLYHEISHHILETLDGVEEEQKCDMLGAYLMKLAECRGVIESALSTEN